MKHFLVKCKTWILANKKKTAGFAVMIAVIIAAMVLFVQQNQTDDDEEIAEETIEEDTGTFDEEYADFPDVDFETLLETNDEVVAWIRVPGTDVDYPVLRNADADDVYDDYYLDHTIDGTEGYPGSIYMQPISRGDFSEFNTVIYGHNMKNGTMFTTLHNYEDETFFEEHPYIYIVTPDKKMVFEVDAAVTFDNRHLLANYDILNEAGRQQYIDDLYNNGYELDHYRDGVTLSTDDILVTLSTCISGMDENRYLVVGRLIEEM